MMKWLSTGKDDLGKQQNPVLQLDLHKEISL